MNIIPRKFTNTPMRHGKDEKLVYFLYTTNWGTAPSNASVKVFDGAADVTSSTTFGSVVVLGDKITLPRIQSLTPGKTYRIEVKFDDTLGNTWEAWGELIGEE